MSCHRLGWLAGLSASPEPGWRALLSGEQRKHHNRWRPRASGFPAMRNCRLSYCHGLQSSLRVCAIGLLTNALPRLLTLSFCAGPNVRFGWRSPGTLSCPADLAICVCTMIMRGPHQPLDFVDTLNFTSDTARNGKILGCILVLNLRKVGQEFGAISTHMHTGSLLSAAARVSLLFEWSYWISGSVWMPAASSENKDSRASAIYGRCRCERPFCVNGSVHANCNRAATRRALSTMLRFRSIGGRRRR